MPITCPLFFEPATQQPERNGKYQEENTFVHGIPEVFEIAGVEIDEQEYYCKISRLILFITHTKVKNNSGSHTKCNGICQHMHLPHLLPAGNSIKVTKY